MPSGGGHQGWVVVPRYHATLNRPRSKHKKACPFRDRLLVKMAEWTGLEPATPGVTGRYSNQLNYHSALKMEPGGDLLSHGNCHTTIGAVAFHF